VFVCLFVCLCVCVSVFCTYVKERNTHHRKGPHKHWLFHMHCVLIWNSEGNLNTRNYKKICPFCTPVSEGTWILESALNGS
jgi:hypothetical protein